MHTIRPLVSTDLPAASALLATLNPETPEAVIEERLDTILTDYPHYHLIGAFAGDKLEGVAGRTVILA